MRFLDFEVIEDGERVVVEMPEAVDFRQGRHVGGRIAARGIGDATMAAREIAHLRLPVGVVGRKFMQEQDRCSAARLLEIETDIVARNSIGHRRFLL